MKSCLADLVSYVLSRIRWRRVILDEAQMVESTATAAAEMAARLPAEYRWCVTGTPLSAGLQDFYGLLLFLKLEPWSFKNVWNAFLRQGESAWLMLEMITSQVMWRSTKQHVSTELCLPPQTHRTVPLHLSAVEREFYCVVEGECTTKAR